MLRIEELEVKLAALAAKSEPTPAARAPVVQPAPMPVKSEPRPQLKTVKLGEGRRLRRATDRVRTHIGERKRHDHSCGRIVKSCSAVWLRES